jgi:hypothetical protein
VALTVEENSWSSDKKDEGRTANTQLGLVEGGGEHWKPLFFSVGNDGTIHIPDFYKARIAVYDKAGKLFERAFPEHGESQLLLMHRPGYAWLGAA